MTRTHKKVTELTTPACLGPDGSAALVERALHTLDGRWKLAIVFRLFGTPVLRFSELRRSIARVSQKMLVAHLRELERDGLVRRTVHPTVPPKVEYALTDVGLALQPILRLLRDWSTDYLPPPAPLPATTAVKRV